MADSMRTENVRHEQLKNQIESSQERQLRELREKHRMDLERVMEHNATTKNDLEHAYNVTLSLTKDEQDRKISDIRATNDKLREEEKLKGEEELEKVKARYHDQIARYKQNSEKQLSDLKKSHDLSAENIKQRSQSKGQS